MQESIPLYSKTSFDPIADSNIEILILGSLPGDTSLQLSEYYGHSRNRFWKILASITKSVVPINYQDKKDFLLHLKIGLWDVAQSANRKGSLDSAMENVKPNDLRAFLETHKNINTIGFNGGKAATLYDKYFQRFSHIHYIQLPSSSPANARASLEQLCVAWKRLLD